MQNKSLRLQRLIQVFLCTDEEETITVCKYSVEEEEKIVFA